LKQWTALQIQDRNNRRDVEAEKERQYSEYVLAEDVARCKIANEERQYRENIAKSVMIDNFKLSKERQSEKQCREEEDRMMEAKEVLNVQTSPFFSEETEYDKSILADCKSRPDHFKGLKREQIKSIYESNALVAAEREGNRKQEQKYEEDWAQHEAEVIKQLENYEAEKQQDTIEENRLQANVLESQREELKQKQRQMKKDGFGTIENGFFERFGRSCR